VCVFLCVIFLAAEQRPALGPRVPVCSSVLVGPGVVVTGQDVSVYPFSIENCCCRRRSVQFWLPATIGFCASVSSDSMRRLGFFARATIGFCASVSSSFVASDSMSRLGFFARAGWRVIR
jgi:hypothetical protein